MTDQTPAFRSTRWPWPYRPDRPKKKDAVVGPRRPFMGGSARKKKVLPTKRVK